MSQKSAVHHCALVPVPAPSPVICSSFGISSDWQRCQNLDCSLCCNLLVTTGANMPQHGSASAFGMVCDEVRCPAGRPPLCMEPHLVLRNGLSLPWTEVCICFSSRECNKWMSSSQEFQSGGLYNKHKADSMTQVTSVGQVSYMGGKIFLAGRSSWDSLCPRALLQPFTTSDQSFPFPPQHCLTVCDLTTLPLA